MPYLSKETSCVFVLFDVFPPVAQVDAGADFVITQFFYDTEAFLRYVKRCREVGINCPIIPGIMAIQVIFYVLHVFSVVLVSSCVSCSGCVGNCALHFYESNPTNHMPPKLPA